MYTRLFVTVFLMGCYAQCALAETKLPLMDIALSAEEILPLGVGDSIPNVSVRDTAQAQVDLLKAVLARPTVLIFYRGGWCPYCTTHLGELAGLQTQLIALGYQTLAVSADRPEKVLEAEKRHSFSYRLLSDSKMRAAIAFGLAFKVDDQTVKLYKEKYNIDLEADSGETHHLLPVPAAYVVDTSGRIRYAYHNSDYKKRIDPGALLEAAKAAVQD